MTDEPHMPRPSDICSVCGNGLVHIDAARDISPAVSVDVERLAQAFLDNIPAIHRWLTVGWKDTMADEATVLARKIATAYEAQPEPK